MLMDSRGKLNPKQNQHYNKDTPTWKTVCQKSCKITNSENFKISSKMTNLKRSLLGRLMRNLNKKFQI